MSNNKIVNQGGIDTMVQKQRKQGGSEGGFTIIEVLIVLAIAGLILLIVFLAVPALQRNSRNTQRKEDVSRMLSAAIEAANNNNWNTAGWGVLVITQQAVQNVGTMSIYQNVPIDGTGQLKYGAVGGSADADVNNFNITYHAKCSGETTTVAQQRGVAILYRVETGGGSTEQCESA